MLDQPTIEGQAKPSQIRRCAANDCEIGSDASIRKQHELSRQRTRKGFNDDARKLAFMRSTE